MNLFPLFVAVCSFVSLFAPSVLALGLSGKTLDGRKFVVPLLVGVVNGGATFAWEYLSLTASGLLRFYLLALIVGFGFSIVESLLDMTRDGQRGSFCALAHSVCAAISGPPLKINSRS